MKRIGIVSFIAALFCLALFAAFPAAAHLAPLAIAQHLPAFDPHALGLTGIAMAGVMTPGQVRVVDPVLSNVAQGYKHVEHVGSTLFPRVNVTLSGGQVLEFGKESFKLYNSRRAPGAATKRIQFGYLGKPYALVQESLEGQVPYEHLRDANRSPGINLGTRAVNNVMGALSLRLEYDQAQLATNAANYDANHKLALTAGTDSWADAGGKPSADIDDAKEAVRASVGIYPNTVLLSAKAFKAARNNANIVDRFKYTSRDSITTAMLANLWDVQNVVVGKAVAFDDDGNAIEIWGTGAVVAYVPPQISNIEQPSFGYTYTMEGSPMVEQAYYDKNSKSWIYPTTDERQPVLTGIVSGFLIQNAG